MSVSVASGAQSQVKYPPPTLQSVRGACPPRPLSLIDRHPPLPSPHTHTPHPTQGHPPPLTTWKMSATIRRINWVLKRRSYSFSMMRYSTRCFIHRRISGEASMLQSHPPLRPSMRPSMSPSTRCPPRTNRFNTLSISNRSV